MIDTLSNPSEFEPPTASSEFETKEGGFNPVDQQLRIRKLLDLPPGASEDDVQEAIHKLNAEVVDASLHVIPEENIDIKIRKTQELLAELRRSPSAEDTIELSQAA